MQEGFPKIESEDRLIQVLKERGPDSPEAKESFTRWVAQEEKVAQREPMDADYAGGVFDLEMKKAGVFTQAGLLDLAIYYLEGALTSASEYGVPEHWDEANAELERVRGLQ